MVRESDREAPLELDRTSLSTVSVSQMWHGERPGLAGA